MSYEDAVKAADVLSGGDYEGIGFMLHGTNLIGIDFDNAISDKGIVDPYTLSILKILGNPYTEKSPSGRGLHAFVDCDYLPEGGRKMSQGHAGIEIYHGREGGRYFTITGDHVGGETVPHIEDISLAYLLITQNKDKKFKALWLGDTSFFDGDESSADCAMMIRLANLTKCDPAKMEKYFSASVLGQREKWVKREDYRQRTIKYAVEHARKTEPGAQEAPEAPACTLRIDDDSPEPALFLVAQKPSELSDKPIEWIIEGMYATNSLSLLCGREGIGKGVFSLLGMSPMLHGGAFLGHKVNPVPHILLVDMENPEAVVRARLAKIGLLNAPNLLIWGQWNKNLPPITHFDDQIYMDYALKTGGFIFFDSLIDFSNGADENSAPEMNDILTKARFLARHCAGVHIQCHSDKYGKSGWRGTTAITAASDMSFGLRAEDDEAFRKGTNREVCFSTIKPKMCAPYHIEYEIVGWEGQLAYRLIPQKTAKPAKQETRAVKSPTKLETALDIGRAFIVSNLNRDQKITVGMLQTELDRNAYPQKTVREAMRILRAQFVTQTGDNGDQTVRFISEKPKTESSEVQVENERLF
ncbi:MAG: AAA family ATPase [Candidatus Acidiferrales bacterium]